MGKIFRCKSLKTMKPGKKYDVIYLDPPWQFDNQGTRAAAVKHYNTMPFESLISDIARPMSDLMADNCAVFLWCPGTRLQGGIHFLQATGANFKTVAFVWNKLTKDGQKLTIGLGNYSRNTAEFVLLGIKGSVAKYVQDHGIRQSQYCKELEKGHYVTEYADCSLSYHSRKPDHFRQIIEQLMPGLNYIELFARNTIKKDWPNWDFWGVQA